VQCSTYVSHTYKHKNVNPRQNAFWLAVLFCLFFCLHVLRSLGIGGFTEKKSTEYAIGCFCPVVMVSGVVGGFLKFFTKQLLADFFDWSCEYMAVYNTVIRDAYGWREEVRGSQHGPSEREEGLGLAHGPCPTSLSGPVEILKDESTAAKARIAVLIGVLLPLPSKKVFNIK
jgi:hypothetical protein